MQRLIMALIMTLILASAAVAQIKPETAEFLREIGIDPDSPAVLAVANDKVSNDEISNETLDTIAADRAKRDIKKFIATRNFIRDFYKTGEINFPPEYDGIFLTTKEQIEVGEVVAKKYLGVGD